MKRRRFVAYPFFGLLFVSAFLLFVSGGGSGGGVVRRSDFRPSPNFVYPIDRVYDADWIRRYRTAYYQRERLKRRGIPHSSTERVLTYPNPMGARRRDVKSAGFESSSDVRHYWGEFASEHFGWGWAMADAEWSPARMSAKLDELKAVSAPTTAATAKAAGADWFHSNEFDDYVLAFKSFVAGGGAGAISKTVVAPMERVKILAQTEHLKGIKSTIPGIARRVWEREGLFAFWKGNFANVVRIVPNKGILFMCNDQYMRLLTPRDGSPISDWHKLVAGSLSGATVVTFTYPLDITQTRLATAELKPDGTKPYSGIIDCMRQLVRKEGFKAFTKGYWPSVLGIMPYTGAQFYAYDKISHLMRDANGRTTIPQKLAAGALAGVFAQSISYPLDTIRRRMQVQGAADGTKQLYRNSFDCAKQILRTEGVTAFYRGVALNALRAGPSQAVQFASYGVLKNLLGMKEGHH